MGQTERYVVGLLEQLLGPRDEKGSFDWAVGDVSPKTGRAVPLPFDAVWEDRGLIIEVDEEQHREATPFFDKVDRLTVSGVHRGEQRRLYDERKRAAATEHGYKVIVIEWTRSRKARPDDLEELRWRLLADGTLAKHGD